VYTHSIIHKRFGLILFNCLLLQALDAQSASDENGAVAYTALQADLDSTTLVINTASTDELGAFPLIQPDQVRVILGRQSKGLFIESIDTLGVLMGWSAEETELARPYLDFRTPRSSPSREGRWLTRLSSGSR
jgi:DNA uptake protein ComE-like DNA-binding protein